MAAGNTCEWSAPANSSVPNQPLSMTTMAPAAPGVGGAASPFCYVAETTEDSSSNELVGHSLKNELVGEVLMMKGDGNGENSTTTGGNRDGSSTTGGKRPADHKDATADVTLILDSGATVHASGNRSLFSHIFLQPEGSTRSFLRMANKSLVTILGLGTVRRDNITLHGVLFAPGLSKNIVSVSKLGEMDYAVEFTRTSCFIRESTTGDLVGGGHIVNGLYELDFLEAPRLI